MYINISIHIYIYIFIFIFKFIHTNKYIHINTYIYKYIYLCPTQPWGEQRGITQASHICIVYIHRMYIQLHIYMYIQNATYRSIHTSPRVVVYVSQEMTRHKNITWQEIHKQNTDSSFWRIWRTGDEIYSCFLQESKYGMHIPCAQHWVTAWLLPWSHAPTSYGIIFPVFREGKRS